MINAKDPHKRLIQVVFLDNLIVSTNYLLALPDTALLAHTVTKLRENLHYELAWAVKECASNSCLQSIATLLLRPPDSFLLPLQFSDSSPPQSTTSSSPQQEVWSPDSSPNLQKPCPCSSDSISRCWVSTSLLFHRCPLRLNSRTYLLCVHISPYAYFETANMRP